MFRTRLTVAASFVALLTLAAVPGSAHDPDYTDTFDREGCTFTSTGNNPYFPLWPGSVKFYEGEELDDDMELVEIANRITVLPETELVDGVVTRVIEEYETEDGELIEVSRNFFAHCRETGDVWYFGEDVDDYEDGVIVGHGGAWRSGVDGATPGIVMPATPLLGARHFQEVAPGIAEDIAEVGSLSDMVTVPAGTFTDLLRVDEDSALEPGATSTKWYAHGTGLVKDDELELVDSTPPPCQPDATTLCLNDGRFRVKADWTDFDDNEGDGSAILPSADAGEFWFFNPNNTELIVKVLDACSNPDFNSFWVFAAGLTNVELTIEVTDTQSGQTREYDNDLGVPFQPILDTQAFSTCP